MEFKSVYKRESHGSAGSEGIQVLLGGIDPASLTADERNLFDRAAETAFDALRMSMVQRDPAQIQSRSDTRQKLVDCFPMWSIYVEEVPNEYCSKACCWASPWLIVTTTKGRIKIGWRKRVIVIDWTDSSIKDKADSLFPHEDVTKTRHSIHAWGHEKAKEYLAVLLEEKVSAVAPQLGDYSGAVFAVPDP